MNLVSNSKIALLARFIFELLGLLGVMITDLHRVTRICNDEEYRYTSNVKTMIGPGNI